MMQQQTKGITLIEIMLVIMLLILSSVFLFSFFLPHQTIITPKEQQDILIIENALKLYRLDNGFYPSTNQGLKALIKKPQSAPIPLHWIPYLTYLPLDSRGKAYHYKNFDNRIELLSCGPSVAEQGWWYWITHYFSKDKECL